MFNLFFDFDNWAATQPIMADLTIERLAYQSFAFANNSLDYFGPT